MFSAVIGLFSQDLAVDPGSTSTRIHLRGSGIVCDEPTAVAVRTDRKGRRTVAAIGSEARAMIGRTPSDLQVIEPVSAGRVADPEVAQALLLHLVRRCHGRNGWIRPSMVVTASSAASPGELAALRSSCASAGARRVHIVPRAVAAALGADLPVSEQQGTLVVDLGGGSTEVAILSCGAVVHCTVVPGGGAAADRALVAMVQDKHGLLIGRSTAEELKLDLGSAIYPATPRTRTVAGRCLRRRVPRAAEVHADDVFEALQPGIDAIASAIDEALSAASGPLADGVRDRGVVLTGGGAKLRGLERALRTKTGLAMVRAEAPARAAARGAGRVTDEPGLLRAVAC